MCVGVCEYARSNTHNRWYVCVRVRECACWGRVVKRRKEVMVLEFILKASPLIDLWPCVNWEVCKPRFILS